MNITIMVTNIIIQGMIWYLLKVHQNLKFKYFSFKHLLYRSRGRARRGGYSHPRGNYQGNRGYSRVYY